MPEHDSPMGTFKSWRTTPRRPRIGVIAVLFADSTVAQHCSAPVVHVPAPPAEAEGVAGGEGAAEVVDGVVGVAGADVVEVAGGVVGAEVVGGAAGVEDAGVVEGVAEVDGAGADEEEGVAGSEVDVLPGAARVATTRIASTVKPEVSLENILIASRILKLKLRLLGLGWSIS